MLNFLKKKETQDIVGRRTAAIFVDYEHWYYGYNNKFSMKPNVSEWYDELNDEYIIKKLMFFGDFSKSDMEADLPKLKKYTEDVVPTASTKDGIDKDFTDFIILDEIYREAAKEDSPEVFIIFTGDAHFNPVVNYLRDRGKRVKIFAVKYALSNKLKSSANSYVEMPRTKQEQQYYYDAILTSLSLLQRRKRMATYQKTIEKVSDHSGVSRERIKAALDDLLNNQYIFIVEENYKGKKPKVLKADWRRLEKDGLYNPNGQKQPDN